MRSRRRRRSHFSLYSAAHALFLGFRGSRPCATVTVAAHVKNRGDSHTLSIKTGPLGLPRPSSTHAYPRETY
jgi:hypothetical protein